MARFCDRFRLLRREVGLSQQDLADQLRLLTKDGKGFSKSSINMYERGEREPSIEALEVIADYFNVDMDYLTGKSEHRNKYAWLNSIDSSADTRPKAPEPPQIENPDIRMIARAGKKMTAEQAEALRKLAEYMYPEAFKDDE